MVKALGKPELLQGGTGFTISSEYALEVAVWYQHLLQGEAASLGPSLKLWLPFCREHEKLPWVMNSGFLVLRS